MTVLWQINFYETAGGKCPAKEFLDSLEAMHLAYVEHKLDQLAESGKMHPDIRPLGKGLFEFKIKCGRVQIRLPFFYKAGNSIVITHGFQKRERDRTQQAELEKARRYKQDHESGKKG